MLGRYARETGVTAVGLDTQTPAAIARPACPPGMPLQGNLDPLCLLAQPEAIRAEVARVLASYGHGSGHIFNLGHGITPQVNPEHAGAMIQAVVELSPQYHQRG